MDEEGQSLSVDQSDLPSDWQIEHTNSFAAAPLANVRQEIETRLSNPLHTLPLADLCGASTNVVIVCDAAPWNGTRALILGGVLAHLERAGVAPERVTVLIPAPDGATEELDDVRKLLVSRLRLPDYASDIHVVQHDPDDVRELDALGNFEGVPLTINYRAAEADLLIAISLRRLGDDASRVGGSATIAFGVVGTATARELRTTRFYDDRIESSDYARPLIERVVREGARRAGLVFAVDGLEDADGCALAIRAGTPNEVDDAIADLAEVMSEASVASSAYDVALADTGQRGNDTLFDVSRAAINLSLARNSVLMRGGSVILPVGQRDDDSATAQSFYDALTNASSPDLVIQQLQGRSLNSGEARAYLLAHAMQRHHLIAAGPQPEQLARDSHFVASSSVREAAELAENYVGKQPRALIVRRALSTIPVSSGSLFNIGTASQAESPSHGRAAFSIESLDDLLAEDDDPFGIEMPRLN